MKRSNFAALILGIIGGVFFALGMCMTMVFDHMVMGIVIGLVGIVVLLMLIPLVKGIHD